MSSFTGSGTSPSLPNVVGTPDVVVLVAGAEDLEDGQDVANTKADLQALLSELATTYPSAAPMIAQLPAVNGIDPTALNVEIADLATTNEASLLDFNTGVDLLNNGTFFNIDGAATVASRTITAIESVLNPAPMGTLGVSSQKVRIAIDQPVAVRSHPEQHLVTFSDARCGGISCRVIDGTLGSRSSGLVSED